MNVSLYAQISLKNRPKGYRGMTGESLAVGKSEPASLNDMIVSLFSRLAEYYGLCYPADELNIELDELAGFFSHVRFQDAEDTVTSDNIPYGRPDESMVSDSD